MISVSVTRRQKKYQRIRRFLIRLGLYLAGVLIVIMLGLFCVRNFGTQTVMIDSAMAPTIDSEDVVLVDKMAYRIGDPQHMDIAVVRVGRSEHGPSYIRRIIGLPGESVRITNGQLFVNDTAVDIDYNEDAIEEAGAAEKSIVLGEDEYFVFCDDYNNNRDDSRLDSIGLIERDQIIGRVWFRLAPAKAIGRIK